MLLLFCVVLCCCCVVLCCCCVVLLCCCVVCCCVVVLLCPTPEDTNPETLLGRACRPFGAPLVLGLALLWLWLLWLLLVWTSLDHLPPDPPSTGPPSAGPPKILLFFFRHRFALSVSLWVSSRCGAAGVSHDSPRAPNVHISGHLSVRLLYLVYTLEFWRRCSH